MKKSCIKSQLGVIENVSTIFQRPIHIQQKILIKLKIISEGEIINCEFPILDVRAEITHHTTNWNTPTVHNYFRCLSDLLQLYECEQLEELIGKTVKLAVVRENEKVQRILGLSKYTCNYYVPYDDSSEQHLYTLGEIKSSFSNK